MTTFETPTQNELPAFVPSDLLEVDNLLSVATPELVSELGAKATQLWRASEQRLKSDERIEVQDLDKDNTTALAILRVSARLLTGGTTHVGDAFNGLNRSSNALLHNARQLALNGRRADAAGTAADTIRSIYAAPDNIRNMIGLGKLAWLHAIYGATIPVDPSVEPSTPEAYEINSADIGRSLSCYLYSPIHPALPQEKLKKAIVDEGYSNALRHIR